MGPPDGSSKAAQFCYIFTIAFASYKVLQTLKSIKDSTSDEHKILENPQKLQLPKRYLSPQYFRNPKGLWIYHRDWILPQDVGISQPKGVVIIAHGLAEHIGRYEHLAKQLNREGFAVYGIDHQGHGMSDGDSCFVNNFDDYVEDILLFSERIRQEYPNKNCKLFLFGQSMGGLIAARVGYKLQNQYNKYKNGRNENENENVNSDEQNNQTSQNELKIDENDNEYKSDNSNTNSDSSNLGLFNGRPLFDGGIILSSPAFSIAPEQDLPNAVKPTLQSLSNVFPKAPLIGLRNDVLSHEPSILYHLKKDPLHFNGKIPLRTAAQIVEKQDDIMLKSKSGQITFPFLLFGGSQDKLCYPGGWKEFFNHAKTEDKTFEIFDGLYHETLNETQVHQQEVFEMLLQWMLKRIGNDAIV